MSVRVPLRCSCRTSSQTACSAAISALACPASWVTDNQQSYGSMVCHGVSVPPQSKITASKLMPTP